MERNHRLQLHYVYLGVLIRITIKGSFVAWIIWNCSWKMLLQILCLNDLWKPILSIDFVDVLAGFNGVKSLFVSFFVFLAFCLQPIFMGYTPFLLTGKRRMDPYSSAIKIQWATELNSFTRKSCPEACQKS